MMYDVQSLDQLSGTFSIATWVKHQLPDKTFFGTRGPSDESFDVKLDFGSSKLHADIENGSSWITTAADATATFATDEWHHVAYAVTPSGYVIYFDANQIGSGSFSGSPLLFDANHDLVVGDRGTSGTENFSGLVDDLRIYDHALTLAEVQAIVPEPSSALAVVAVGFLITRRSRKSR